MLWLGLATLLAGACVYVSYQRWQITRVGSVDPEKLAMALGRATRGSIERARGGLPDEHPARELLGVALEARPREQIIALMNELLSEISGDLRRGEAVPRSAARIALASGATFGVVAGVPAISSQNWAGLQSAGACLAVGLIGGFGAMLFGKSAQDLSRRQKEAWDKVVYLLMKQVDAR